MAIPFYILSMLIGEREIGIDMLMIAATAGSAILGMWDEATFLVLSVLIPSALIGTMTVATAVFFHEASELLSVANGLRMAR